MLFHVYVVYVYVVYLGLSVVCRTMANDGASGLMRCRHRWCYHSACAVLEPCTDGFVYTFHRSFRCPACSKLVANMERRAVCEHPWIVRDQPHAPVFWHSHPPSNEHPPWSPIFEDTHPESHLLVHFVVESAATPTRRTRNSKTLDELNAHSQEGQLTALDDEFSHPSVRGNNAPLKGTGSFLHRKFASFSRRMRSVFSSLSMR
ncbi:hypothetical protein QTP70_015803 [Hemibagrus guttatus]|uniref:Uncharacterized protein n=1 Tax=Hemibagrus guttatus TaxID=175788 RepID=A0AAE0PQH3_9TELE|nr:hypothetical protein QTP70_015803 [Hemibagrus guttatus]